MRDDLAIVALDGEAVIYDEISGQLHHLNPTASLILSLCDGTSTVGEMSDAIGEAFGMPAAEIERQVRPLLGDFDKARLLIPEHDG